MTLRMRLPDWRTLYPREWLKLIPAGEKTCEFRGENCTKRGWVHLSCIGKAGNLHGSAQPFCQALLSAHTAIVGTALLIPRRVLHPSVPPFLEEAFLKQTWAKWWRWQQVAIIPALCKMTAGWSALVIEGFVL